jgi:hypothetical protein
LASSAVNAARSTRWQLIDKDGKLLSKDSIGSKLSDRLAASEVDSITNASASVARVPQPEASDNQDNISTEQQVFFKQTEDMTAELKPHTEGNRHGYANKFGIVVIPCVYEQVSRFSEGLAAVKTADGWGYIDKQGTLVIKPQYVKAGSFSDGFACVLLKREQ